MEKREKANNSWHNGGKRDKGEGKWLTEGQSAFYVCAYMYLVYNTDMTKIYINMVGWGREWWWCSSFCLEYVIQQVRQKVNTVMDC